MGNRHERLDAVFMAIRKEVIIELQPLLIGLRIIAIRENAAPGNRCTEYLKAHLGKQLDIFLVTMIEINAFKLEVVRCRLLRRPGQDALWHDILDIEALAVFVIRTFALIGRHRAAPKESFWKFHVLSLHSLFSLFISRLITDKSARFISASYHVYKKAARFQA